MGPARLEIAVWQGRGAIFRVRTTQDNSKEVLGMVKVLSLKETTAQWCQIREGDPAVETACEAQLYQKEGSTARECQTAWSARRHRRSERIKNAAAFQLSRVGAKPALDASGCAERGSHASSRRLKRRYPTWLPVARDPPAGPVGRSELVATLSSPPSSF